MSDRIINYYEFRDAKPDWTKIREVFHRNVSKFGGPYFEAGSRKEGEFIRFCETLNVTPFRKTIVEYDGKGGSDDGFIYLSLKDDSEKCIPHGCSEFIDSSVACSGGDKFGICCRGSTQSGEVRLLPSGTERIGALDFLQTQHPFVPRVYLVSARLADALRQAGATGCEFLSCGDADCRQLRITSETIGPVRIGRAKMGNRCPSCGVAKMFLSDSERYFYRRDLNTTDFQLCHVYAADNLDQFEILNGFPIVSRRIFNLLLKLKVKGVDRYTTDPPIRHAVVQVREE